MELGSVTPMLDFQTLKPSDMPNLHLQVEVKPASAPDTDYVVLDADASSAGNDRSAFTSVPFAMNANLLDNRQIGTLEGDIPILGVGGQFEMSLIPSGTENGVFVIDADDTETEEITLQFGLDLAKKLTYDLDDDTFIFNDKVTIQGDLDVTGLINGATIGPKTHNVILHPEYAGASYHADGSDNVGQLQSTHDSTNGKNYYLWSSTRDSLQDYDIVIPYTLPQDFLSWTSSPLEVSYRTETGDAADNQIDISLKDTAGNAVTLSGDNADLKSTDWADAAVTFEGSPTWSAGGDILIVLKVHSKDEHGAHVGKVVLNFMASS